MKRYLKRYLRTNRAGDCILRDLEAKTLKICSAPTMVVPLLVKCMNVCTMYLLIFPKHFWIRQYVYMYVYVCMYVYIYIYLYFSRLEHLNGIQWSWVQIPLGPTFYCYFWKSFSGEYHMYQFTPLQRDYQCETSLKSNVATMCPS